MSHATVAQVDRITLTVAREQVGIGGVARPGTWTPMRVALNNPSPDPRRVALQWSVSDSDGDTVLAQRVVTLTPQRDNQWVWLYACPPLGPVDPPPLWQVSVFDWADGRLGRRLADPVQVRPAHVIATSTRAIGLATSQYMGLDPFEDDITQHERCYYLRGLEPSNRMMPDRWHGLSMLESYIWTSEGGDPGDAGVPSEAMRQWVQRGGHLVIVLSNSLGWDVWAKSPLASILPELRVDRVENAKAPKWFGPPRPELISYFRLQPTGRGKATVIFEDDELRPVVVAGAYGFGRVTVVGFDLTDPKVRAAWDEYRVIPGEGIWGAIFGWRAPAFRRTYVDGEIQQGRFQRPMFAQLDEVGRFIQAQVSRSQTIAAALLLSMLVFALYWLAAGPVGFAVLRGRAAVRHSWLAFVAVIGAFSVVTWGGAILMRPSTAAISHLTVLDADAATRTVHARSWMSLFIPEHRGVELTLAPEAPDGGGNLWSSAGLDPRRPETGYVDRQSYALDAAAPTRPLPTGESENGPARGLIVPMRATTKSMHVDYLGPLQHDSPWLSAKWVMPAGDVTMAGTFPVGRLRHSLPGELRNTLLIYCPGGNELPWVVDYGTWPPDVPLDINFTPQPGKAMRRLVTPPSNPRTAWGGFLGELKTGSQPVADPSGFGGQPAEDAPKPLDAGSLIRHLWMLSFFSTLPPPDYESRDDRAFAGFRGPNLARSVGRELDISALTGLKRLIVIGMMERSPLPVPLAVDRRRLDAEGWTLVRWHLDLE